MWRKELIFLETDGRTKKELLAEIKNLKTRIRQLEQNLKGLRKDKNDQEHTYEENHIRWSKERNGERATAAETLYAERVGRHHAEQELGETKT